MKNVHVSTLYHKVIDGLGNRPKLVKAGLVAVVAGLFLLTFVWAWCLIHEGLGEAFTQDSYAYYLLSKNLFSGLGYTSFAARDLSLEPSWPVPSRSFPPLHPLLVGTVDALTGLKIRAESVMSLVYLAGLIVMTYFLGRALDKRTWLFVFFGFVAFYGTNEYFLEELMAGRSIAGMMLFFLLAVWCFLKSLSAKAHLKYEILCGAMLACSLLMRFDQTLFSLAFLLFSFLVFWRTGHSVKQSLVRTGVIAGALVIVYLPWAVRNIIQFGAPFASDNTGSTTTTFRGLYCCKYWLPGSEPASLFTHPGSWFNQRLDFFAANFKRIVEVAGATIYVAPALVMAAWRTLELKQRLFVLVTVIHFCTTWFTISLTPYNDMRYFSLVHLNLAIVCAMCVGTIFKVNAGRIARVAAQTALVSILVYLTFSDNHPTLIREDLLQGRLIPQTTEQKQADFDRTNRAIDRYLKKDDVLSVKPNAEGFAYFTGRRTVYYPSTLRPRTKALIAWLKEWGVDYLLVSERTVNSLRLKAFVVTKAGGRLLVDMNAYLDSVDG